MALTEIGEIFLKHAKESIKILDDATDEVRNLSAYDKTNYTVVSAFRTVDRGIEMFLKDSPHLKIDIIAADSQELYGKIANGTIDFGISFFQIEDPNLENTCVMKGRFCAAFPLHTNNTTTITMEELSKHRLFCHRLGHTRQYLEQNFEKKGMHVNIIELDAKDILFEVVSKGLGIGICMPMLSDRAKFSNYLDHYSDDSNITFIPISDAEALGEVHIVTRKNHQKSRNLEHIIDFISQQFHENDIFLQELIGE